MNPMNPPLRRCLVVRPSAPRYVILTFIVLCLQGLSFWGMAEAERLLCLLDGADYITREVDVRTHAYKGGVTYSLRPVDGCNTIHMVDRFFLFG